MKNKKGTKERSVLNKKEREREKQRVSKGKTRKQ